ncbi:MAG: cyanoexosortase A system-associated protein [Cyanophyceae cyanobacterium]
MTVLRWRSWRLLLLCLVLGGSVGVLLKTILWPQEEPQRAADSLLFPTAVPLPGWQLVETTLLAAKNSESPGQLYQYRRQNRSLEISARYQVSTDGSVNRFLVVYTPIRPATVSPQLRYQEAIGYYSLFQYKDRGYLSACINPRGKTTVTEQQFTRNGYLQSLRGERLLLWLLGQNELFDNRCLWTLLSTPVDTDISMTDEQILEEVWSNWHRWWQAHFPPATF